MERLTKKVMLAGHEVNYVSGDDCFCVWSTPKKFIGEAIDRLAAYEDTGLSPETVSDLLDRFNYFRRTIEGLDLVDHVHFGAFVDRVKRWAQAEKDGRLVVLPCKVGDRVLVDCRRAIVEEFFGYETEEYLHTQFYDNMQYIDIPFDEIGKTVFLIREEDEAALKKRGTDNETD